MNLLLSLMLGAGYPLPIPAPVWNVINAGVPEAIYGLHFLDERQGSAVGWGGGNGHAVILTTRDSGRSWIVDEVFPDSLLFSIQWLDATTAFAVGQDAADRGLVVATRNGGETWARQQLPETFGLYDVDFVDEQTGFACGYNGRIYKSEDRGASWDLLPFNTGVVYRAVNFVDASNGFALGGGAFASNLVYGTQDGGASWSLVAGFNLSTTTLSDMGWSSARVGFLAGYQNGVPCVLRTSDGGSTWEPMAQTGGLPFQAIHVDGDDAWAVGANSLVFTTHDGGDTWNSSPLPGGNQTLSVFGRGPRAYVGAILGNIYAGVGH